MTTVQFPSYQEWCKTNWEGGPTPKAFDAWNKLREADLFAKLEKQKQTSLALLEAVSPVDMDKARKLFDLWVNCNLCVESGAYSWGMLTPVRQLNWINMARRIRHGELS